MSVFDCPLCGGPAGPAGPDVDRVMSLGVKVMQATAALDVHANSSVRALIDVETLWAEAMRHWMAANDIPLSRAAGGRAGI